MADRTPSFSISIEWENARFADLERSRRMLRRLSEEVDGLAPPRNLRHFFARALHSGRDKVMTSAMLGRNTGVGSSAAFTAYRERLGYAHRRIVDHHRDVGLGLVGAGVAYAMAFSYATLQTVGEIVTIRRPGLVQRLFPM